MNDVHLEHLRFEMIDAFYEYDSANPIKLTQRMTAWDDYCTKRERFLEYRCQLYDIKYVSLRQTLVELRGE